MVSSLGHRSADMPAGSLRTTHSVALDRPDAPPNDSGLESVPVGAGYAAGPAVVPFGILYPAVYVNSLEASSFAARSASSDLLLAETSTLDEEDEDEAAWTKRVTPAQSARMAATLAIHLARVTP
jgi:hypothetical protein